MPIPSALIRLAALATWTEMEYTVPMLVTSGTVVDGRIIVPGKPLIEGSRVTILAPGGPDDRPFELEPDEENALLEAIGQADRGEVV